MTLYNITVEYRENAEGLAVREPRFSWKLAADERDTVQTAYRVRVSAGSTTVWDSGEVESAQSVLVPYAGAPLQEETAYQVAVSVRDNHGHTAQSGTTFTTGIFDPAQFSAQMITHDFPAEETACPVFFREFAAAKPVAKAFLYTTAHGVYETSINGRRVGDEFMAPGWTSYHKRLQYQYHDVTALLAPTVSTPAQNATVPTGGKTVSSICSTPATNLIEITVGNGWYKGVLSFDCIPNRYGDRTAAFAELHLLYDDGTRDVIKTDTTWSVRTGTIRYSEIYGGETIDTDAPHIQTGTVSVADFAPSVLVAQENEPVRVTERLPAKHVFTDPAGNHLVDFGQNLTGLVELHIQGEKGQKVVIRHAETLDKDGVFYPDTLRTAASRDTYILDGTDQTLMPHFTFHGFRYIAVEGVDTMKADIFTACVMHSDMPQTGSFQCSNPVVNQLQSNISWSMRGNFLDIPTDCPQRDERLGWMGDAQVFSWTAAFNRNTALFYRKWMHDVAAESSLENGVPHIVPDIQGTYSSAAWSDAAVIIPWVVYQTYGDTRILEDSWQCMHEWVDYIHARVNEHGLWMTNYQYGDWLALDREQGEGSVGATDIYFVANAYYIYVTDIVAKTAAVLNLPREERFYRELCEKTLASFREEFYTTRGRIVSETQTACALSLHFGLARETDRATILKTLTTNIENHKNHLTTGFVGTPYLCHALSDNGAHSMAGTLFMQDDFPSWLYAVKMGATTIWERWDGIREDGTMPHPGLNSMNHYAYGSIGDWMYRKIGGINQLEPGYHRFSVKPLFVRGIEESRTEFETVYGKIVSAWSCRNHRIHGEVHVPANTTAVICLPEKDDVLEVGSGVYEYDYETTTSLAALRFSMDSTLGEVMAEPEGKRLLDKLAPELMQNPMIEYAKRMTLAEGISSAPQIRPVYEAVLAALNGE